MALVSNIQLQDSAVKPPNLDANLKYTAAGLTATEAIAVGAVPVSTSGAITVKSANDIRNWIQTTKTDGNVEIYMSNDARPDWALRVAGTADNAFVIANSYGNNCTAQFPAFSIGGAGAVGLGKTGATNILDIAYKNSATGGIQLTETQNSVGMKLIAEATSGSIGSTSNHKLGFRVNGTTVAAFNTSTQFGIGTDSPGATLDVRGAAIFNEAGAAVDFRIEGDTNQNLFFVDGSSDRVGIGSSVPDELLNVFASGNANIKIKSSGAGAATLFDSPADEASLIQFSSAGTQKWKIQKTATTEALDIRNSSDATKVTLLDSGNLGIGTATPSGLLHLSGVDDPEIRIQGAADGDPQINFYQGASTCRGTIMYKDTGDNFVMDSAGKVTLQTSSTPRLVITNAGCVGIGTNAIATCDSAELDVFSTTNTGIVLRTSNTSAASSSILGEGYRADADAEQVLQVVGRNKLNKIELGIFEVSAEAKHCLGALEFKTFDGSSMATKMKINSGGCVGIGTATPNTLLHLTKSALSGFSPDSNTNFAVEENSTSMIEIAGTDSGILFSDGSAWAGRLFYCHGNDYLYFATGQSNRMVLNSTGLGIGTTAPAGKLHVEGSCAVFNPVSANAGKFEIVQGSTHADSIRLNATGTTNMYLEYRGYNGHQFVVDSTEGMRLTSTGLGIGATAPEVKLDVQRANDATTYGATSDQRAKQIITARMQCETVGAFSGISLITGAGNQAVWEMVNVWKENYIGDLAFKTRTGSSSFAEVMRLNAADQRVGIGTTAPSDTLDVRGGAIAVYGQNTSHAACVLKFGHEGAGLHQIRAYGKDSSTIGCMEFTVSASDGSGGGDIMTIANAGVGIGIGAPEARLDVSGTGGGAPSGAVPAGGVFIRVTDTNTVGQGAVLRLQSTCGSKENAATLSAVNVSGNNGDLAFNMYAGGASHPERMRLTAAGSLGIGTTAPCTTFHSYGAATIGKGQGVNAIASLTLNSTSAAGYGGRIDGATNNGCDWQIGHNMAVLGSGTSALLRLQAFGGIVFGGCAIGSNSVEHMRLTAAGNVGIGTTAPVAAFHVNNGASITNLPGNTRAVFANGSGADAITRVGIYAGGASAFSVLDLGRNDANCRSSFTYNASADSLTIGTAGSASALAITTAGEVYIQNSSDQGAFNLQVGGTGVHAAGAYVNGSDEALKHSIEVYDDNALDIVSEMKPVTFEYKESYSSDRSTQIGFIAQDLQKALEGKSYLNGVVKDDSEYLNVAYQSLIPILTKALQEAVTKIETLENKVVELESAT